MYTIREMKARAGQLGFVCIQLYRHRLLARSSRVKKYVGRVCSRLHALRVPTTPRRPSPHAERRGVRVAWVFAGRISSIRLQITLLNRLSPEGHVLKF